MRKPTICVSDQVRHNRPVQAQKMARGWKFWIYKEEELNCTVTAQLICAFVFAYANRRFYHAKAHMFLDGYMYF